MSDLRADVWSWLRTAPLPVVLAFTLLLAGWVWAVEDKIDKKAIEQAAMQQKLEDAAKMLDKADQKLDKLLEVVTQLSANAAARERQDTPRDAKKVKKDDKE